MAALSASDTKQLMHLYANKNLPELKRVCYSLPMGKDFYALARVGHDMTQLLARLSDSAKQDPQITEAIDELQALKTHLQTQDFLEQKPPKSLQNLRLQYRVNWQTLWYLILP